MANTDSGPGDNPSGPRSGFLLILHNPDVLAVSFRWQHDDTSRRQLVITSWRSCNWNGNGGLLSLGGQDKAPREKKNTLMLFSFSFAKCPAVNPSREGSVSNDATPTVNPYSARCVQDKIGYSSSLHPLAVMEDVQLCFLWRESRERAKSPCCRASQVGRALKRFCAPTLLAMVSFSWQRCRLSYTHLQLKLRALRPLWKCDLLFYMELTE